MISPEAIRKFQEAGAEKGFNIPDDIITGKILRFPDSSGKKGNPCWAVLHQNADGSVGGAYGNWSEDTKYNFFSAPDGKALSKEQESELKRQFHEALENAKNERQKQYESAAQKAKTIWDQATEADPEHQYLKIKKVRAFGIKQSGNDIIIPLQDEKGKIWSVQNIGPDGKKKFMLDGKVHGCFYAIGDYKNAEKVFVCEGYATGATIFDATQIPTIVAFNAGNLESVCKKIKGRQMIIAADNDLVTAEKTEKNPGVEAAYQCAKSTGATILICPVNSDFNDYFCQFQNKQEGQDALRKTLSAMPESPPWEDPVPLDAIVLPTLNLNVYPDEIREMIFHVSQATETPPELAASLALATISVVTQGKIDIEVKNGYRETLNTYNMVALESGNRKSGVLKTMLQPVTEYETQQADAMKSQIRDAKREKELSLAKRKHLTNQYAKGKANDMPRLKSEIASIDANMPEVPTVPRLSCQDVTPEKLPILMAENSERIGNFSAEGGLFDTLGGRYSNNIPNIDIFLQAHSGDTHIVDRAGRESFVLLKPCLTIGLSPQPSILKEMIKNPVFRHRGLAARFLYFIPVSTLGYRSFETAPVPQNVLDAYSSLITYLAEIETIKDNSGRDVSYIITLSTEAYESHLEFSKHVEMELRPGGEFENMKDWAGKLPGAAARIAGLFHCAKNIEPWKKELTHETMESALELAAVYSIHAKKVFCSSECDPEMELAEKVLNWITREDLEIFSIRDCFEKFKGTTKKVQNLEPAIIILQDHNFIRPAPAESKRGRKSRKYLVNPIFLKENKL